MKILIILERNLSSLPPLMTIISAISENHQVTVLYGGKDRELELHFVKKGVKFLSAYNLNKTKQTIYNRIKAKIQREISFYFAAKKSIKNLDYDLLWIGSLECAIRIKHFIHNKKYVLNIYELYDRHPNLLAKIRSIALNAQVVIVPEYNRANILKLWLKLKKLPIVLPNKPVNHPLRKFIPNEYISERGKKIILYQGHVTKDRNLEALCKATKGLSGYELVLMGDGDGYLSYLLKEYKHIRHIDFVKPPIHLNITSWAYIGIVTYDFYSLNTLFCAPNKIWEYGGFGIPMIANDIPGLQYTVGKFHSGLCVDTDDELKIKQAIQNIEQNYEYYSKSSLDMFDRCDVRKIINSIFSFV